MKANTKKLTTLGMFCAVAYVMVVAASLLPIQLVPSVPFLHYDPKDVVIAICGFIYGPLSSFAVSLIVSFLEMITFSSTGIWGFLMNVLSSCAFTCTAALIYRNMRRLSGAVAGLITGVVAMATVMMLWNYLITPIYLGYPREMVASMLLPAFLPFNAIKGGLNAGVTMLLYKPLVTALRKARLLEPASSQSRQKVSAGVILVSLLIIASLVLLVLALNKVI